MEVIVGKLTLMMFGLSVCFAPALVAVWRDHHQTRTIFVLNLFLGAVVAADNTLMWTWAFVVALLVYSVAGERRSI